MSKTQNNRDGSEKSRRRSSSDKIRGPRFKKSLGQNFLRDKEIAYQIAEAIPTDLPVLEIGPGDGFLTEALLDTGHKVTAVEIDVQWMEKLKSRLRRFHDFKLIAGNILKMDWEEYSRDAGEIVVAGNLPYHLASTTLFTILQLVREGGPPLVRQMVVMMQREVGARVTASCGNKTFGSLTLLTQYHAETEYLFTVPADRFIPRPRVDGAVIKLNFRDRKDFPPVDYDEFRRIVRGCFAQRRKMIRNSLGVINDLPDGWQDLDYDFTLRPEQFSFEEFVNLVKDIVNLKS